MEPIISARGLGKSYRIQIGERKRYRTLRDDIADLGTGLLKGKLGNFRSEEFWALKDIDLDIYPGEVVGIIGRNGAGKSTLLKVLSRIIQPTQGEAKLYGRVASLLEVGTGFHPELTGRENIFMSGAVLGMKHVEIKDKFYEIVDFSGIEKFLDTPVKRYSSGMYVKLAFSVAAHLSSEILFVDEILAVGDSSFQKKCIRKMEEVGSKGRTILFVSHNMSIIQKLCERCIVLDAGETIANDITSRAVNTYLELSPVDSKIFKSKSNVNKRVFMKSGEIFFFDPHSKNNQHESLSVSLEIFSSEEKSISIDVRLTDYIGLPVGFGSLGTFNSEELIKVNQGSNLISFSFSTSNLAVGSYRISIDLTQPDVDFYDRAENCFEFEVIRPPKDAETRVLSQSWQYGSMQIKLRKEELLLEK
jgi:lipopolysaccharide transport system ATP-binding protein